MSTTSTIKIEDHLPLVRRIARVLKRSLPDCVDEDDLIQDGYFGLVAAAERFDPDRGVTFPAYAYRKIYGSMIDRMRQLDWVPRYTRRRERKVSRTIGVLTAELGRAPVRKEVIKELHVTKHEGDLALNDVMSMPNLYSLSSELGRRGRDDFSKIMLGDSISSGLPPVGFDLESRDAFLKLIAPLHGQVRYVFIQKFWCGRVNKDIGRAMGLGESRISQLVSGGLQLIRAEIAEPVCDNSIDDLPDPDVELPVPVKVRENIRRRGPIICHRFPGERFSLAEAADLAGVSMSAVYSAMKDGRRVGTKLLKFVRLERPFGRKAS
jgi:RNA polymerase sigma factor for flagellar operon FliA